MMKEYVIVLYTRNDKFPSDRMSREKAAQWIKKNAKKAFTVSLWENGEYARELSKNEALSL